MTTPTREQVVQIGRDAGVFPESPFLMPHDYIIDVQTKFFTLSRADLEATIAEQAAELESLRKDAWISVSDQLPEPYEWVLVVSGRHIYQGWFVGADDKYPWCFFDEITEEPVTANAGYGIKYWMPLPAAPKQEK